MIEPVSAVSAVSQGAGNAQGVQASLLGSEADISGVQGLGAEAQLSAPAVQAPEGFGGVLGNQIQQLNGVQQAADQQSQLLASGQAQDVTEVVMAAERAQLAMQLATSLRNRGVDAYNELMRTQI